MKLSIKSKLLISILGSCAVVYFATVLYIGINNKNMALNDAKKLIDVNVSENALKIEKLLNYEMAIVKTMAYAFNEYDDTSFQFRNKIFNKMYKGIFDNNPQFYAIWDSWEMSYTDTGWTLPYGRYVNQHIRHEGKITRETITKSMDGDNADYKRIKDGGDADWFEEPYIDNILMTSLITPLYKKGEFIGVIGVDISLERFQQITKAIAPFDSSYAFLLSNKGIYVSTRDTSYIGKPIHEVTPEFDADSNLISNIKSGKYFSYEIKNLNNMGEYYVSFAPIYVGEIEKPWSLAVTAPTKILMIKANQKLFVTITIGIIGLIVITLITWLIAQNITVPLVKATNALKELAMGNIDKGMILNIHTKDETGDIANSVNTLINNLNHTVEFANQIGKGNYDKDFQLLSDNDTLGNSLIKMKNSLKIAEEEKRKREIEDEKHKWATNGLAKFAELLRQNNNDIKELAYVIISNLVKYLEANQGGFFIINDNDKNDIFIELSACYAYDRRKYIEKRIDIGVSLVGRCVQEKTTIFLTDIPDGYIGIKSGLGTANPTSLLIVPLKLNEEIFGVVEIASFKEFEQYQISFVERVGESIAATVSSVKVNIRTAKLLEQTQQYSQQLSSQEEEMRQNMEELLATQEESNRREAELIKENQELKQLLEVRNSTTK